MTDVRIGFRVKPDTDVAVDVTIINAQGIWRSLNNSRFPNMGWIDWFGFMAKCDALNGGILVKVPVGTVNPENVIFNDGSKLWAQPGYDYANMKEITDPAQIYFYVMGSCGGV